MGAASRRAAPAAWLTSCVALCLLPAALPLLLLCLPLLCVAVAVSRFRRRRRRLMTMMVAAKSGRCCHGEQAPHGDEGHRAALLHKYLEDQMELVGADATVAPAAVAMDPTSGSQGSHQQQQ